jgi:hypothetical protein
MKRSLSILLITIALLAGAVFFAPAQAAEEAAAAQAGPIPFTLLIMGTRHYSDVDVMRRNIARIAFMQRFVQTVAAQNHLEFAGSFGGAEEALVADVRGLAADRYDVQTRQDKTRGLVITLRKIQTAP